jgi:pentose-5-phosphate-3-epimerase
MVGFPGESEEDFTELCEFIKEAKFDRFGAFTYSEEEGTVAAELDGKIDGQTKQDRYDILMQTQLTVTEEQNAAFTECKNAIDDIGDVLVMTVNPGFAGQKMVPACLDKIRNVREYLDARGRQDALIEVDGNVSFENAVKMRKAGADILVAGTSSIFHKDYTLAEGIRKLREVVGM